MSSPIRLRLIPLFLPVLLLVVSAADPACALPDLKERVQALTAPELAGRGSGVSEAAATSKMLAGWLKDLSLEPAFDGSWYQEFPLRGEGWLGEDLTGKMARNVAGILPGSGDLADRYIVVGAHYDHLGRLDLDQGDRLPGPEEYYPGANDNASGVTALFELAAARKAADPVTPCRSLLVLVFAAEEAGLQGSAYFVAHSPVPLDRVDAMINFDTVGQLTDNRLYVSGIGTAAELPDLVAGANTGGLVLSLAQGGWSGSDHMSFNTREIPVLFIFGGPYVQYNTPADTWDTLNYVGLRKIAAYADRLTAELLTTTAPLQWVMVAQPELRQDESHPQDRSSWLGTLPDFTEEIQGYKLAGVFNGSPAARAGLLKGDVIVSLGGMLVTDLVTFTDALRSSSPGDLVEIRVLRGGKPLNFTVVLGDRKDRG